mmetsp:Transcript_61591/g.170764  ORF Transcript_61591/g.170764 Transcript_61591/m.170764 type:complete len:206 (-) Transcript_61591:47-664(-)
MRRLQKLPRPVHLKADHLPVSRSHPERQDVGLFDAKAVEVLLREVDPAQPHIVANVTQDVCQLNGNAKVNGSSPGVIPEVGHAQHRQHHQAHRAGHAIRVVLQLRVEPGKSGLAKLCTHARKHVQEGTVLQRWPVPKHAREVGIDLVGRCTGSAHPSKVGLYLRKQGIPLVGSSGWLPRVADLVGPAAPSVESQHPAALLFRQQP